MNDDIILLSNGDFEVRKKNPLKPVLECKFQEIRPISAYHLERMYTQISYLGNNIQVGDKILFLFVQTKIEEDPIPPERMQPDWLGFARRICIMLEREIGQYDLEYELASDSKPDDPRLIIQKKGL